MFADTNLRIRLVDSLGPSQSQGLLEPELQPQTIWMTAIIAYISQIAFLILIECASACDESGYCSIGVSKPWVGDIRNSKALHSFLASVPYMKEIIIASATYAGPLDPYGDVLLQLHYNLMSFGFAHHSFIAYDVLTCQNLSKESQDLSCAFDSGEEENLPAFVAMGAARTWVQRLRFIARVIRLGFNVLCVDADSIFFRDPYVHLKHPPLSTMHHMCNPEAGNTILAFYCNGGFHYIHDVAPDGPIAWVFYDTIRTILYRADDDYNFSSRWMGHHRNCQNDDQAIIADSLLSAAVGRPLYQRYIWFCKILGNLVHHLSLSNGQTITLSQAYRNMEVLGDAASRGRRFSILPNKSWLDKLGWLNIPTIDSETLMANLSVPNMNYGFPPELGGSIYDPPSGRYSNSWEETLKSDCPSCPWFNDKRPLHEADPLDLLFHGPNDRLELQKLANESMRDLFIDPNIKQESFGYSPRWFSSSLVHQRRGMAVGPAAMNMGYLSIGHIHAWGEHIPSKMTIRKYYGAYNFSLGAALAARRNETPYETVKPFDRVIALDPTIDLSRLRNIGELASIVTGLIQLAKLSHRVFLIPEIPCYAQFIYDRERLSRDVVDMCSPPILSDQDILISYPVDRETGELLGGWSNGRRIRGNSNHEGEPYLKPNISEWWINHTQYKVALPLLLSQHCTKQAGGIIAPDLHHWLKTSEAGKRAIAMPSDSNRVLRVDPDEPRLHLHPSLDSPQPAKRGKGGTIDPLPDLGWSWYDVLAAVSVTDAMQEMRRVRDEPLVFVSHPVRIIPSTNGKSKETEIEHLDEVLTSRDPDAVFTKVKLAVYGLRRCGAISLSVHGIPTSFDQANMFLRLKREQVL